jgi:dihydrolipoamide dehydrogenase
VLDDGQIRLVDFHPSPLVRFYNRLTDLSIHNLKIIVYIKIHLYFFVYTILSPKYILWRGRVPMAERVDILVIGAGPGGHAAALEAARLGARTAIIERQGWGGTCTHRGCIPTKALLTCSGQFAGLRKLKRLGVNVGEAAFDYAAMKRHQEQIVKVSALGVAKSLQEAGVEMLAGEGRIAAPGAVEWTAPDGARKALLARDLVIAWGSEPGLPPGVLPSARILTSDGLLALKTLPQSLIIVGGNVIGVEFATFLAELGVKVTLIELLERLLPGEEQEASTLLTQELTKIGVAVHTGMGMESIRESGSGVEIRAVPAAQPEGPQETAGNPAGAPLAFSAEYALIATGRRPSLRTEELDALGIRYDRRGIAVDAGQRTSVPGIYAIGDVTGGMMLAHRAMQQGKALAGRLCGASDIRCLEEAVPAVVYTHPQIARVGLTEAGARKAGLDIQLHRADFGANLIARAQLLGPGFVKMIFQGERFLGATVAGEQAGELIAPLGLALTAGLGRKALREWIIPHPTLSEVLGL